MVKRSLIVGGLSLVAAAGCVPEEKYRAAKAEAEQYRQQMANAQVDITAAQQKADALQKALDTQITNGGGATALVDNLNKQLAGKQSEIDALNARYTEAIAKLGAAQALPAPLANELAGLAASNPDLVDFDAGRGIIKFKSDLTFDVGDATLKPAAKDVLTKFAGILNSGLASQYELLVAGHTDAQPVSNPATIQRGHKDNWYLSAHRAITVGEALVSQKVNAGRLGVVGYADQRPVASNGTDAGRAQNRRVEVLILPTQVKAGAATQPSAVPAAKVTPSKDAATATPMDTK